MSKEDKPRRLEGKVAVVTGAGRGIGRSEALLLAREGAKVVVNDIGAGENGSDQTVAQTVVGEIRDAGGEAVDNGDNVVTMEGAKRIIETALDSFGRLDILINNAGIVRPSVICEMTEEEWDAVLTVNLKGHFTTIRHAAPIFRDQGSGVIINTASESGLGHYGMSNYAAAKEGVVGLTRTVARELGRYNVRCNAIRPVAYTRMANRTVFEMNRISQEELGVPAIGNSWMSHDFAGDISPDMVAVLSVWLCTDIAAHVNGHTFQVGGGIIGLYSEPEVIRANFRKEPWTLDRMDNPAVHAPLIGHLRNRFMPIQK
jgi:3-oxoacyl-[acyl-carrier protein] reductase